MVDEAIGQDVLLPDSELVGVAVGAPGGPVGEGVLLLRLGGSTASFEQSLDLVTLAGLSSSLSLLVGRVSLRWDGKVKLLTHQEDDLAGGLLGKGERSGHGLMGVK